MHQSCCRVGYAACHWCHVMAHESFEDATVAAAVNASFVAVKVDREERPDIDAVYMAATTALTGHGGWPMTCFLTPEGEPFYCGTYYPRAHVPAASRRRLARVDGAARGGARGRRADRRSPGRGGRGTGRSVPLDAATLDAAAARLEESLDRTDGGFGRAPKFPPSMVLEFLLRQHARTGDAGSRRMVDVTADAMARGGIYDQLAGGFARYSVDASWVVPHFEKMLYDNAQLLRVYLHSAGPPAPPWPSGSCARRPSSSCASCAPPRAGSPPPSTPTPAAHEGLDLRLDARRARGGPRPGRRRPRRRPAGRDRDGDVRAGFVHAPAAPRPRPTRGGGPRLATGSGRPAPTGHSRPATTRSSRPGTVSPSPRWPRPARSSASPPGWRPRGRAPS